MQFTIVDAYKMVNLNHRIPSFAFVERVRGEGGAEEEGSRMEKKQRREEECTIELMKVLKNCSSKEAALILEKCPKGRGGIEEHN